MALILPFRLQIKNIPNDCITESLKISIMADNILIERFSQGPSHNISMATIEMTYPEKQE